VKRLVNFVVLLVLLAVSATVFGQVTSVNGGSIQGTITDSTGAVVPGAVVVVTGIDTGSVNTTKTDSAGFYGVGPLNPGNYTVTITEAGFSKLSVTTVVRTGTSTTGSYKLTIGSSSTTIDVNAGAIQINTEQAGVSGVITTEQLTTLPVNGRNILDFAQLQPGVQMQPGGSGDGGFDPTKAGYSALSFSGTSGRTTRILLDGQDITDETVGTTIYNVSQGSVGEIEVSRATQDVSGDITSGGSVLASTKSGTNSFHGQVFYDFQDQRVGAATYEGQSDPFQRNQFGGSVGGPIFKDKLFFFANAERLKQDQSAGINLPSLFSAIQAAYPSVASPDRDTYSAARLDWNAPRGIHAFVRINYEANSFYTGSEYSTYANRDNAPGIAAGADYAVGKFTHSIHGSYEKFHNLITDTTTGNTSLYNPIPGVDLVYDTGQQVLTGPNPNAPQQTFQSDKQLRYDGSWTKGAHQVRFGGSLNRIEGGGLAAFFGFGPELVIDPSTLLAGPTLADPNAPGCNNVPGAAACPSDLLNGYTPYYAVISNDQGYASEKPAFGLPGGGLSDWRTGFYLVDAWKIRPSFTLIAGARYDRDTGRSNSDLAPIPCSEIVAANFSSVPCTGSSQLFDQWGAGLGNRVAQPNRNVGPQLGFTYAPAASPKTVLKGGIGVFFESNVFNNVQFDRASRLPVGKFALYPGVCGPFGNSYTTATGPIQSTGPGAGGTPISTICNSTVAQAAPGFLALQADARAGGAENIPNGAFAGNNLDIQSGTIAYSPAYRSPYSININFGIQREIAKNMVITADYVHIATLRIQQTIDQNHVGDSRYLNVANAQAAIAATLAACGAGSISATFAPGGCPSGSGPNGTATISDFASNGLDSGVQLNGGVPNTNVGAQGQAAFAGVNPAVGVGTFSYPEGKSGYDGLQLNFREQRSHPLPGIDDTNLEVSYAYSRFITTAGVGGTGSTSDQFFSPPSYNNRSIAGTMGNGDLDRTHIFSLGGSLKPKFGPRVSVITHFESAQPLNLTLDEQGGNSGEIFRSDVDGDGQVGDLIPGTNPGAYMRGVKPGSLNKLITNYNSTHAGTLTPAGQALVSAGLFTANQLVGLQAVEPTLAPGPAHPFANSMLKTFDANFSYPIRLKMFPQGLSLEPAVSIYNIFNFANYSGPTGTVLTATDQANACGSGAVNGALNGLNGCDATYYTTANAERVSRKTGTFDQGAPRATEFQLKLNF